MDKKIVLFCSLVLGLLSANAQVTMTLQVPPMGVLVKNQLWNMVLINTSNYSLIVRLNLTLLDEKTNQPVLTATTAPIVLNKGAKQILAKDLGPINYTYMGPAFQVDRDPNGMLPVGNYQACYTVASGGKVGVYAENCIHMAVDPLSPPLLNTPADENKIYTAWPQFTWLPPTPVKMFNDLSYDLVLVEVLQGQGKSDAIQQNIPVYSGGFIRNMYLNYPSSYKALDTGRLYAWRIVALNNGQPASMSEIWTFRVTTPPVPSLRKSQVTYFDLHRGLDPSVATAGNILDLTYDNIPADTLATYTITGLTDPGSPVVQQGQLSLIRGLNLLEVQLSKTAGFTQDKIYLFRLNNSRNESWTFKFTQAAQK